MYVHHYTCSEILKKQTGLPSVFPVKLIICLIISFCFNDFCTVRIWDFAANQHRDNKQRENMVHIWSWNDAWPISSVSQGGLWEFKSVQSLNVKTQTVLASSVIYLSCSTFSASKLLPSAVMINQSNAATTRQQVETKMQIGALKCRSDWDSLRKKKK